MINHSNGKNRKNINFECLQELHSGFGYAFACIPFLQAFKKNEKFIIFAFEKTNLYTQKRDTTHFFLIKNKQSISYCKIYKFAVNPFN